MEIEGESQNEYVKYYHKLAENLRVMEKNTLEVDMNHLKDWHANQNGYDLSKFI